MDLFADRDDYCPGNSRHSDYCRVNPGNYPASAAKNDLAGQGAGGFRMEFTLAFDQGDPPFSFGGGDGRLWRNNFRSRGGDDGGRKYKGGDQGDDDRDRFGGTKGEYQFCPDFGRNFAGLVFFRKFWFDADPAKGEKIMIKALLGPNGAGKSTYLRRLMGLESGEINPAMAMVFQEPLLFDLTVFENVALGLRFRKASDIENKVMFWLEKLKITPLKDRRAITLSGGEAQKAALARALVLEPKTLLLDEPFANLDLPSQLALRQELKGIISEKGISAVWVTHNKAEALAVADILMIMIDWKIVQEGEPEDVLQRPANRAVAVFLGIENIFHGSIFGSIFKNQKICFEVAALDQASVWAIVHPEDIILSAEPLRGVSARNCLAGVVAELNQTGLTYLVKINAGEIFKVLITRSSKEELALTIGQKIFLTFKPTAVKVI